MIDFFEDAKYDVIDMIKPLFAQKVCRYGKDRKIHLISTYAHDTPWVHTRMFAGKRCGISFDVIFKYLDMIPTECMSCWKVVVKPRTLTELFDIYDMQQRLNLPSKCGIENRDGVYGIYGAYFYNNTPKEGLVCLNIVRKEVDKISPDIPVFLKRGCTEIERKFGDSNKWTQTEDQMRKEINLLDKLVEKNVDDIPPEEIMLHTKRKWIAKAYDNGDKTYLKYTGGKHLREPYVTYEE